MCPSSSDICKYCYKAYFPSCALWFFSVNVHNNKDLVLSDRQTKKFFSVIDINESCYESEQMAKLVLLIRKMCVIQIYMASNWRRKTILCYHKIQMGIFFHILKKIYQFKIKLKNSKLKNKHLIYYQKRCFITEWIRCLICNSGVVSLILHL